MLNGLLLAVTLSAQSVCAVPGYPLDADFSTPQELTEFVEAIDAPAGAQPERAATASCRSDSVSLVGAPAWWRLQLVAAGQLAEPLLLQVPSRAAPSLCVHWPQRVGYVSQCQGETRRLDAGRYYNFLVPQSMQWSKPVLIEVRDALFTPEPIQLVAESTALRGEHSIMLATGLFVGLMTTVALICLLAWVVVRRTGYLYAASFVLMLCFTWVGFSGRGLMLPGAVGLWLSRAGPMLAMALASAGILAYVRAYLMLNKARPLWPDQVMMAAIVAHGGLALFLAIRPSLGLSLLPLLIPITALGLATLLIWQIAQGSDRARYLLVAFALLMLSGLCAAVGWLVASSAALSMASALLVMGLIICPMVLLLSVYRRYDRLETERNQAEQALLTEQRLALMRASYCRVTGLPRRPKLAELVERLLEQANADKIRVGVFLLQVDNLSLIRQQYGIETLEEVVAVLGQRLREGLDSDQLLGRLENWELVVVVPAHARGDGFRERLYEAARDISECLRAPLSVAGQTVNLSVSVGMSIWPLHGQDFNELMRRCDSALYEAQSGGGNAFKVFNEQQHAHRTHQFRRISDLKQAMERNELELFYQPLHNALTGEVASMEALIRWHHPEHGLLTPGSFVPLAEKTELILDLGYWTLHAAAHDLSWFTEGGLDVPMAINVSPRQFAARGFVGHIREIVYNNTFAASALCLEITENSLIDNWDRTQFALTELQNLGVGVFVDDFGVGYSSLNYVRSLPIEGLKIDRSFVKNLGKTDQDEAVVSTIIRLARSLDLKIIAEGVETEYQRDFLRIEGCHQLQGHLYSEPLPRDQLLAYVRQRQIHAIKARA